MKLTNGNRQIKEMPNKAPTKTERGNAIVTLKRNKAHGADGIIAKIYIGAIEWVAGELYYLYKDIRDKNQLSGEWTRARIAFTYKNKGRQQECENYRPISLLNISYEIRTTVNAGRLSVALNILTSRKQFGYKKNSLTVDALNEIEDFLEQPDNGAILLGLTKAFDDVDRQTLWATLYGKGLPVDYQANN